MDSDPDFLRASRPVAPSSYGIVPESEGELLPWSWANERFVRSRGYWLTTVGAGGRPQLIPIWGVFLADRWFCFGTDVMSRKARNLEQNRQVSVAIDDTLEPVIIEGTVEAMPIEMLDEYFEAYAAKYELPIEALNASGSFRVRAETAFGFIDNDTFPNTATRWTFVQ